MLHKALDKKYDIVRINGLDERSNSFNWTFLNNRAIIRTEYNLEYYLKSNLVEYDFYNNSISNPTTLLLSDNISYEDPRLTKNGLSYISIKRDKNFDIEEVKLRYNITNCTEYHNIQNSYEKNWQFTDIDNFLYRIEPFIYYSNKERVDKGKYDFRQFIYGDYHNDFKFCFSTNKFKIDCREFILFHTKTYYNKNFLQYYEGVLELEDNTPLAYSSVPLYFPSDYLSDRNKLSSLFRFREIRSGKMYRYQVAYFTTAHVDNDRLYLACGLNECESILITISIHDFIDWFDTYKCFTKKLI